MPSKFATAAVLIGLTQIIGASAFAMAQKPVAEPVPASAGQTSPTSASDQHSYTVANSKINYQDYDHLDPQHVVPTAALANAVRFFDLKKSNIPNQKYITVIDMTQNASKKRFYLVDMESGSVSTFFVAHGSGSDTNNDGIAEAFSNTEGSRMSSLGFYLTGGTYQGDNGLSLHLNGLEKTNSNAASRAIVMHGADYVNSSHTGRSWGCPAIEPKYIPGMTNALKGGSLLYIYRK